MLLSPTYLGANVEVDRIFDFESSITRPAQDFNLTTFIIFTTIVVTYNLEIYCAKTICMLTTAVAKQTI